MSNNIVIDPVIANRIRKAWKALSPAQQVTITPLLDKANNHAMMIQRIKSPIHDSTLHQAFFAKSIITGDQDQVLRNFKLGPVISIGEYGEIWGNEKYEQLDVGWLEIIACWLETMISGNAVFSDSPETVAIPDFVQIAIAGDWGTGDWRDPSNPSPSTKIKYCIQNLNPHYTIHLGDVYYAGTKEQQINILLDEWPLGSMGAFNLNSNHDMYSGAKPYFQNTLSSALFHLQNGCSYFALENSNWVIVGLDSAYYSDPNNLHRDGSLWPDSPPFIQLDFLRQQIAKNKKMIILTHHNGLQDDGCGVTTLWSQVMTAFVDENKPGPDYWYWGHAHLGAVYKSDQFNTLCRCSGHGAIPWGWASKLAASPNVAWFEGRNAQDPAMPQRVFNGFTYLKLEGANIEETFYDENGGIAWQS